MIVIITVFILIINIIMVIIILLGSIGDAEDATMIVIITVIISIILIIIMVMVVIIIIIIIIILLIIIMMAHTQLRGYAIWGLTHTHTRTCRDITKHGELRVGGTGRQPLNPATGRDRAAGQSPLGLTFRYKAARPMPPTMSGPCAYVLCWARPYKGRRIRGLV